MAENKNMGSCQTCGGQVAQSAKMCPHCGQKGPYPKPARRSTLGTILFLFVGILVISGIMDGIRAVVSPRPVVVSFPEAESRKLCEQGIKAKVLHPSTLKLHGVLGYASEVDASGVRRIAQEFAAKNGFGLQTDYETLCVITPDGKLETYIREKGSQ